MTYTYLDRVPTPHEHRSLSEAVGWGHAFAWDAIPASLAASTTGVVVYDRADLVGMGRVIGDGVFFFYVQDIAVRPDHQGRGVGHEITRRLVARIDEIAPPKAFIGLFAAGQASDLYARHGFATHEDMTGMFRVVPDRSG
ncbi:GNAT family N-acetyltransferase [Actinopolymorpha rutila]|uniref:GNAT superfamily N-acetyltransferase n=1 Tax=Actinopolymorpha rutila TaxID=446787 RepID=A0A852ZEG6_9ACTN|nr:GNAT family N-acetyltransferase [Actinopolymorpha rutila]NYH91294.1 GNAT superfamily N-acetyltransferase [Actinopolymorpha rutila]